MNMSSTDEAMGSPEADRTLTREDVEAPAGAGGSDSGVELGLGGLGGGDGYASGFESLVGGAASTSCESSLLSFSGDLESAVTGHQSSSQPSSAGRSTTSPSSCRSPTATSQTSQRTSRGAATQASTARRTENKASNNTKSAGLHVPRRTEARSASRGRTPPVSVDDGRWPSVSIKPARRSTGSTTSTTERRTPRATVTPPESRSNTFDKYATLPRRTRLAVTLQPPAVPENSSNRESSLNRTASLRRQRVTPTLTTSGSGYRSDAEDTAGSSVRSKSLTRTLPPYPRRRRNHNMRDAASQTSQSPLSREELQAKLERLSAEHAKNLAALQQAENLLQTERSQREALHEERERVASRIATVLHGEGAAVPSDWLAEVEIRLNATSDVAARSQKELLRAHRHNRHLSEELERARGAASTARQQLTDAEEEAAELQEFLAAEKSTLAESLREAEDKVANLLKQLEQKDKDIERHQDECRHLVRLSEQRRQEAEALKAKVASTERLLVSQGGFTTATSVSLASLCLRLESLLPQLNSPKEEVEVFVNEAYAPSTEASPESKRKTPVQVTVNDTSVEDPEEENLSQVKSPNGLHDEDDEDLSVPLRLTGSASLNDLTKAIISCHTNLENQVDASQNASLTDQASELDQLISKLMATFQSLLKQREESIAELNQCKQKYESEHRALLEANSQLEEQQRRLNQLETAQRIAQQSDEAQVLRERLAQRERQLSEMTTKAASSRQLLLSNWRQAADELRRQYEAIDKALEVLHQEQYIVNQNPALLQLQQELEETNFHCVTLPSPLPADELEQTQSSPKTPENTTPLLQKLHMPETVNGTA